MEILIILIIILLHIVNGMRMVILNVLLGLITEFYIKKKEQHIQNGILIKNINVKNGILMVIL